VVFKRLGQVDCEGTTACNAAPGLDGPTGVGTPNGLGAFKPLLPKAVISPPGSLRVGVASSFSAAASSDPYPGGSIASYAWSWGDGSAPSSGLSPTHIFATAGAFIVTLTVTDNYGLTSVASTQSVTVSEPTKAEEEAKTKHEEEEAAAKKLREEEAAATKGREEAEAAAKKAEEEAAAEKAHEEEAAAAKKLEEEAVVKARDEETAASKRAEEEAAAKKASEEKATPGKPGEGGQGPGEQSTAKQHEEEAAAKKREEEKSVIGLPLGGTASFKALLAPLVPDAQLAGASLQVSSSGIVIVKVSCPAGESSCTGTVTLRTLHAVSAASAHKAGTKPAILTLTSGSFSVAGGKVRSVALRLSASGRKLLARAHVLGARATILAHDAAGGTHTGAATVTLHLALKAK